MSASRTLAAGHSSDMGLYEVPCDESLPDIHDRRKIKTKVDLI